MDNLFSLIDKDSLVVYDQLDSVLIELVNRRMKVIRSMQLDKNEARKLGELLIKISKR